MEPYKSYAQKKTLPRMQRKQSRNSVWIFNKKIRKVEAKKRLAERRSLEEAE